MRRAVPALLALLAAAPLAACKSDLPKATAIDHMRILGSMLEVVGDPTRATPKPGESVRVTMATVFPKFEPSSSDQPPQVADMRSFFIACTAPSRFTGGVPVCQEFLDLALNGSGADVSAALPLGKTRIHCADIEQIAPGTLTYGGVSLSCIDGAPATEVAVQKDFKAQQKLLLGVVCERGDPFIDPSDPLLFGCDHDSGQSIRVNALIPVQQKPADENHNPNINQVLLLLDPGDPGNFKDLGGRDGGVPVKDNGFIDPTQSDALWPPAEPGALPAQDKDCRQEISPQNATGMLRSADTAPDHHIVLFVPPDLRKDDGTAEDLEVSIFATAGELERRFSLFGAKDTPVNGYLSADLSWDPPKPSELHYQLARDPTTGALQRDSNHEPIKQYSGMLVRFFITLRDHRGGFSMTTRAACVRLE